MKNPLLFVYGTLKTGQINNFLLSRAECVGPCHTYKMFRLYDCGPFPALVKEEHNIIKGELWVIDEEILKACDILEGHPDLYKREVIEIDIKDNILEAWAYIFNRPVNSAMTAMNGRQWPREKPPTMKEICEHHQRHTSASTSSQ